MSSLPPATTTERASGNLVTGMGLTVIAAISGGPIAALLPVLADSLAGERHRRRVDEALASIDSTLRRHETKLRGLDDQQYKVMNEAILALLQASSADKVDYLRRAVENSLDIEQLEGQEAVVLSRIVRDISAEECDFLIRNYGFDRIQVTSDTPAHELNVLLVKPTSPDALIVAGLTSLGLLESAESTWGGNSVLRYSPIVVKLLVLLRERTSFA